MALARIYAGVMGNVPDHRGERLCVATGVPPGEHTRIAAVPSAAQVRSFRPSLRTTGRDTIKRAFTETREHRITLSTNATLDRLRDDRQETV